MTRALTIALAALFVAWLAAVVAIVCYVGQLVNVVGLVAATGLLIAVPPILMGLLISTNTHDSAPAFGRRAEDKGIIETISEAMEKEAAKRPYPARTPDWTKGIHDDAT